MDIQSLDSRYVAHTYGRFPVTLTEGKGSRIRDEQGKWYIDMGSGIGVTAFGISDEVWTEAVISQLKTLQHVSNLYYTAPCALLAEELCERTGMARVFFGNSGAEANECAVKVARKYAAERHGPDRHVIVTLKNSFHGRTLTTLAATGQEHYHELYQPLTPGFVHAEAGNTEEMRRLLDKGNIAGILVEVIQGEGGVVPVDGDYLRETARMAAERDVLMMTDEVQTGNGRTGALYADMTEGLRPDVVTTAKGLGGGLPIGACLMGEKVKDVLTPGDHGSTYGGNPAACAGALSVLKRIDEPLLAEVRAKSDWLFSTLTGAPGIEDVRGRGLMIGIKPANMTAGEAVKKCMERGVLCLTARDRLRLLPALNIGWDCLKEAAEVILAVCAEKN